MQEVLSEAFETEDKELLIDEIMNQYGQDILRLVYSYVRNKEVAEDLTQDIFVKCYKSLHTYTGKAKIRTWLWRIAINHCKDYLKSWHYKHMVTVETEKIDRPTHTTEQVIIQQEEDEELIQAIMSLPLLYREAIYLFYYEDLSIKEIAQITGIGTNTVKTRLRRAKALLKEQLEE
ncbi:sigma-70 family RNA polymerase sigma factor [Priestia koreensis]|uniref:RNA polymerase factor sigma C n=1 Tax=Priestia koreensis TaxID=284581 RepID=A0A0M0L5B2_9BACI|nr:sigma-70 family RNA polymerase sigma factor [Priestia koreensis]KOO46229.1 RNA polymerase factor sigma C [Priestia koreensis]